MGKVYSRKTGSRESTSHVSASPFQASQYTFAMCSYREKKAEPQELLQLDGYTVDYTDPQPGTCPPARPWTHKTFSLPSMLDTNWTKLLGRHSRSSPSPGGSVLNEEGPIPVWGFLLTQRILLKPKWKCSTFFFDVAVPTSNFNSTLECSIEILKKKSYVYSYDSCVCVCVCVCVCLCLIHQWCVLGRHHVSCPGKPAL